MRALPHVEAQLGFALAGLLRVDLQNAVLQLQSGQTLAHGLLVVHLDVDKSPPNHPLRHPRQLARVGAVHRQHGRDTSFVLHFDQEVPPALLHQFGLGRTFLRFHAALGIDIHTHKAMAVENFLHLRYCRGLSRGRRGELLKLARLIRRQRLTHNL